MTLYRFQPKAKIGNYSSNSTPLPVSFFPFCADEFNTMVVRIKKGKRLLNAHRKHIYQLLANEKGIAHWKVSLGYGLLQAAVRLSVLCIKPFGLLAVVLASALWLSAFFVFSALLRRHVVHPS